MLVDKINSVYWGSNNKNESTKMITQDEMLNYLENKLKSSTI